MGSKENSPEEIEDAMIAQGWGVYLPQPTSVLPKTNEQPSRPVGKTTDNSHVLDDHTYKDGKRVVGLDLGKPGVLEASNILVRGRKSGERGRINNLNRNDFASE